MGIGEKMVEIQSKLNAPKTLYNKFGGYTYRSAETILEAVKPLLKEQKCYMVITDDIFSAEGRVYLQAIVTITDTESGESVTNTAFAREAESKKGQDESQITGTASSYARKYALNGLFLIDDNKDPDTDENHIEREARAEAEKREDPKVKPENIKKLEMLAAEANESMEAICKWAKVQKAEDMSMTAWAKACRMLSKTIEEGKKDV